ncbi:uncharacterized protein LOC125654078 [Ostrea edulis]|uniref:uncharacterized protein LOC125654078 n=1 Tax=Ostrea edulis TaxID=37623 RepID=UPI0024AF9A52|nr:uncharacterized protein LOC125654078 [Ostrea edulis]
MSTLEVDHSSLDVVASWFGQTLSKKRQLDSDHEIHGKCKKSKQNDTDWGGELLTAGGSERVSQKTSYTSGQGQGQPWDKTSSVSAFIQQKVNKKLIKASHKKKEGLVFKESQRGRNETKVRYNKHKGDLCQEEEEEESRFDLISKPRKTPQTSVNLQTKKRRRRKRRKKLSESRD